MRRERDTAVGALFEQHSATIRRYLTGRVGPSAVDDLVSDVFLAACRRWHSYDPARGPAVGWLFGIVSTELHRHARDERRHLRWLLAAVPGRVAVERAGVAGADESVDRVDADRRLRRLVPDLLALDATDRDVLLLVAWAGLSPTEVATALGLPPGTVRSRLHRVRQRLRRADDVLTPTGTNPTDIHPTSTDPAGPDSIRKAIR